MKKQRQPEPNNGITDTWLVSHYDELQKNLRDNGLLETKEIIRSGITKGKVLEIGPGPGYLGLEWLKKNPMSDLFWLEISHDMKKIAEKNAEKYRLKNKITITMGDATKKLPYEDSYFDGVFSCRSLHEWTNPITVFNEIHRVLKPNGSFFIGDLKRNINIVIKLVMNKQIPKKIKNDFRSSINSSYIKKEIIPLLASSNLKNFVVKEIPVGLSIFGKK